MLHIPIVIAVFGTFSSPLNASAASDIVWGCNWTNLVFESIVEPGSLNPIWPERPIPNNWISIPRLIILSSYSSQWDSILDSNIVPEGIKLLF